VKLRTLLSLTLLYVLFLVYFRATAGIQDVKIHVKPPSSPEQVTTLVTIEGIIDNAPEKTSTVVLNACGTEIRVTALNEDIRAEEDAFVNAFNKAVDDVIQRACKN
jgi:hypothetical protein